MQEVYLVLYIKTTEYLVNNLLIANSDRVDFVLDFLVLPALDKRNLYTLVLRYINRVPAILLVLLEFDNETLDLACESWVLSTNVYLITEDSLANLGGLYNSCNLYGL